jgi:hypothetical protein
VFTNFSDAVDDLLKAKKKEKKDTATAQSAEMRGRWEPIPQSTRGGFRRRGAAGKYEYWYPEPGGPDKPWKDPEADKPDSKDEKKQADRKKKKRKIKEELTKRKKEREPKGSESKKKRFPITPKDIKTDASFPSDFFDSAKVVSVGSNKVKVKVEKTELKFGSKPKAAKALNKLGFYKKEP